MKLGIKPICGVRTTLKRRWQSAFTFAEVLAALVFMAIVIPVAIQGMQIANRAGVVAQRKGVAMQLANRQLQELLALGTWRNSNMSGDFSPYWKDYHWRLISESWKEDSAMQLVTLEVTYLVQNREYHVRLNTLIQNAVL